MIQPPKLSYADKAFRQMANDAEAKALAIAVAFTKAPEEQKAEIRKQAGVDPRVRTILGVSLILLELMAIEKNTEQFTSFPLVANLLGRIKMGTK